MKKNWIPAGAVFAACVLYGPPAPALEVMLNAVQFPERSSVEVPFMGTPRAPKATVTADVKFKEGQAKVDMSWKRMKPAVLYGQDVTSYALWAVTRDGVVESLGELYVRDDSGSSSYSTGQKIFALMVTAETHALVEKPSELVIFTSGTVEGAKNAPFKFSTFGPAPRYGNESIAEFAYQGKTPLDILQAQRAYELAERMKAEEYEPGIMREAKQTLSQATNLMAGDKKAMLDYARRSVALSSEAMRDTSRRIEAKKLEELIAQRRAEMAGLQERADAAEKARAAAEDAGRKLEAEKAAVFAAMTLAQGDVTRLGADRAALQAEMAALAAQKATLEKEKAELEKQKTDLMAAAEGLKKEKETLSQRLSGALSQVAETKQTARGYIVNLPDILFDIGKASLKADAQNTISKLAGILIMMPELNLRVEGHTDNTGSDTLNQKLSEDRAEGVVLLLKTQGISASRQKSEGYGPRRPAATNDTKEGRAKNRRVEIVIAEGEIKAAPGN